MGRRRVSPNVKRRLARQKRQEWRRKRMKKQNNACHYCGREMKPHRATLDHRVPLSRGGRDHWENVVASCRKCNEDKADMTDREFFEQLPEAA